MKRNQLFPAAALAFALAVAAATAAQMSVQVKDGVLRSKASFLGSPVGNVAYGDRVDVLSTQSGWSQVRAPSGATGWIHESALTSKRVVLSAASGGDVRLAASSDEVALAGKGFSQEVETEYKKRNRSLDYAWVDRMLTFKVSDAEALRFLREGGLEP